MAKVYDIFTKKMLYDTDKEQSNNESAYLSEIRRQFNAVSDQVAEWREENLSCQPLNSIVLVPWNDRSDWTIFSLRADDCKQDLIDALEMALEKIRAMDESRN